MKKISLLVVLLSLMTPALYAQFSIMPKAGVSLSSVSLSDDVKPYGDIGDYKSKIGIIVGATIDLKINDMFSLQPEVLFHQKGYSFEGSADGITLEEKVTLNYIEIPVLFKATFGDFHVEAGPSAAIGLGGKYKQTWSAQGNSEDTDGNIKFGDMPENYDGDDWYLDNSFDYGLQVGAGYKIANLIVVDVRYGLGLGNFIDKDSDSGIDDNKSTNNSIQFTVGFPIAIGGN